MVWRLSSNVHRNATIEGVPGEWSMFWSSVHRSTTVTALPPRTTQITSRMAIVAASVTTTSSASRQCNAGSAEVPTVSATQQQGSWRSSGGFAPWAVSQSVASTSGEELGPLASALAVNGAATIAQNRATEANRIRPWDTSRTHRLHTNAVQSRKRHDSREQAGECW